MRFWDSSAIVPLLLHEDATGRAVTLLRTDSTMLVWWGSEVECTSAIARLEREKALSTKAATAALTRLTMVRDAWHEIQPVATVKLMAARLLRVHPLRAADSTQLAAALVAANGRPSSLPFVCFDERLSEAAAKEGFEVLAY